MSKKTIFLTGAGGSSAIYLIRLLSKKYRIITFDANKYAAGLYLADKSYIAPLCTSKNYLEKLDKIIKKEKVDIIIPGIDEELLSVKQYFKNVDSPKVLLPEENFIKLCLDKWELMNALDKNKIPCPKTYLLGSFKKVPLKLFPCIVKPITGRGSRGFQYLKNNKDLEFYLSSNPYKKKDLLLQEFVEGTEYTISVVVSQKGKVLSVVPKEVILKKGITQIAVTRFNKKIVETCKKIQEMFKANGPFNVQLIIDKKNNVPKIFEINPRFSTTLVLTTAAGVNEVGLLIGDLLGEKIFAPKFKKNLVMIRYPEQIYIDEKNIKKDGL